MKDFRWWEKQKSSRPQDEWPKQRLRNKTQSRKGRMRERSQARQIKRVSIIRWILNPPTARWLERLSKIKEELQNRFRKEYVSLLVQRTKKWRSRTPQIGDLVWVGLDDKRRVTKPLGKMEVLFLGRNGKERVASVRTQGGVLIRPLQRLYPMEMHNESGKVNNNECVIQPSRGRQELSPVTVNTEDLNPTVLPDAVSDSELPVATRSSRRVTRPRWTKDYG